MRLVVPFLSLTVTAIIIVACKKSATRGDCFAGDATVRTIESKPATIKLLGNVFYIIEQGTIDTRLKPCSLAGDFKVDNLNVTISGEVKATLATDFGPCCIENFVITKITR